MNVCVRAYICACVACECVPACKCVHQKNHVYRHTCMHVYASVRVSMHGHVHAFMCASDMPNSLIEHDSHALCMSHIESESHTFQHQLMFPHTSPVVSAVLATTFDSSQTVPRSNGAQTS